MNYRLSLKLVALMKEESQVYFIFQLYQDILETVFLDLKSEKISMKNKVFLIFLV